MVQLFLLASSPRHGMCFLDPNIQTVYPSPPQPPHQWKSQQCKSWNKGLSSRDCLMLKPRQSSPPRSKRGPARESRYQGSFIRCRKKSCSCVSHTSLFCGVQAPAFFRFRAPRFKHASALARMTAPRALCCTTMRTCFSATYK